MSPLAECLLVEQIAPRLRATSRCLPQVGADDAAELYQDGLAIAAKQLRQAESTESADGVVQKAAPIEKLAAVRGDVFSLGHGNIGLHSITAEPRKI